MTARTFLFLILLWLGVAGYSAATLYGPELGVVTGNLLHPNPVMTAKIANADWSGIGAARLSRHPYVAQVWQLAGAGTLLVVGFYLLAYSLQRRAGRRADQHAVSYLLQPTVGGVAGVAEFRQVFLGLHQGLRRPLLQRVLGMAPHLAWCDLALPNTPYQSAAYLRVVGDAGVQAAVRKALSGYPGIMVQPADYPTNTDSQHSYTAKVEMLRPSRYPLLTDFAEGTDVRQVLARHLRAEGGVRRIEVVYRLRPAGPDWAGSAHKRAVRKLGGAEQGEWRAQQEVKTYARRTQLPYAVLPSWINKVVESRDFGWSSSLTITVVGDEQAARAAIREVGEHYFGHFKAENELRLGWTRRKVASSGYPVRFDDKQVISPAEAAALCHLAPAESTPGVAASAGRYIEAERSLYSGNYPPPKMVEPLTPPFSRDLLPVEPSAKVAALKELQAWEAGQRSVLGRQGSVLLGIERGERPKSLLVSGPPGVGKSVLLTHLTLGDIGSSPDSSVVVIEPHDLCTRIMETLHPYDWARLIYFNPQRLYERGRAMTLNLMQCDEPTRRPAVQAMLMEVFRAISGDHWEGSGRMQQLLESAIGIVLATVPHANLRDLYTFLTSSKYRQQLYGKTDEAANKSYWQHYFDRAEEEMQQQMIGPVLRRINKLLQNPYAANIVSSRASTIDMQAVVEGGGVLLVNLPGAAGKRGGDQTMALIWQLLIVRFRIEAARRLKQPDYARKLCYFTMDEAHLGINGDVEDMVAQYRKLNVCPTFAFQSIRQLDPDVLAVLSGIVANKVIFRGEGSDAEVLATELLNGEVTAQDVAQQRNYTAYARLMHRGSPLRVCTLETLPPPPPREFNQYPLDEAEGWAEAEQQHAAPNERVADLLRLIEVALTASARASQSQQPAVSEQAATAQQVAVTALCKASKADFEAAWQIQRAREQYMADWLFANPGVCTTQVQFLERLSELRHSVPAVLVMAEARREDAALRAAGYFQPPSKRRQPQPRRDDGRPVTNQPVTRQPAASGGDTNEQAQPPDNERQADDEQPPQANGPVVTSQSRPQQQAAARPPENQRKQKEKKPEDDRPHQ